MDTSPFTESSAAHCSRFQVGGVSVQLAGAQGSDVPLVPSLEPFRVETGVSDINIQIERVDTLLLPLGRELFDSGSVWRVYEDKDGFQFDFGTPFLGESPYKRLVIDPEFRRACLLLRDECFPSGNRTVAPLDYPLDELLIIHRLTQETAIELHSCGIVGPDGQSNLFIGHSGDGKSTTARLWAMREDVEILSDDRIIVRRDRNTSELEMPCGSAAAEQAGPSSTSLGISARGSDAAHAAQLRLCDGPASRPYRSAQDDKLEGEYSAQDDKRKESSGGIRMYGTPWHGEAAFASPASAPLSRICILEHGHGNVLTRLSPCKAMAELFARSFVPFHRHEYIDSALAFLEDVTGSIPCYRYSFEPNQRAVDTILNFRD